MCPQCGSRGRRERDREKKKQFASAQLQLIFHMPSLFEIMEINVRVSSPSVRLGLSRLFTQQAKHLLEIVCPVREAAEGARQCTPLLLLFASVRRTRRTARKERSRELVKKSKTTSRSKTKEQKPDRQPASQTCRKSWRKNSRRVSIPRTRTRYTTGPGEKERRRDRLTTSNILVRLIANVIVIYNFLPQLSTRTATEAATTMVAVAVYLGIAVVLLCVAYFRLIFRVR